MKIFKVRIANKNKNKHISDAVQCNIGRILLNVGMMPKILHYLLMLKFLLRNIRFLASFRCLEFTHYFKFLLLIFLVQLAKWQEFQNNFFSSVYYHIHIIYNSGYNLWGEYERAQDKRATLSRRAPRYLYVHLHIQDIRATLY